jgi:hypothetical protein
MKAYKIRIYQLLGHFDNYGSIGTELVIFAAKNGCQIDQIPLQVKKRKGKSRFGQAILGNLKIFRALLHSF